MNTTSATDRFAVLSARTGVSLGILHSTRGTDFNLMLAVAARSFAPGRNYTEQEVNDLLCGWLASEGSMLAVDHVELRRWLVDCRVLARDDYGRAYALGTPAPEIAVFVGLLSGVDLAAIGDAARSRDSKAREERKRKWDEGKWNEGRGAQS